MLYWINIWRLSGPFGFTEVAVASKTPARPLWLERVVHGQQLYSWQAVWLQQRSVDTSKRKCPSTSQRYIVSSILDCLQEAWSTFSCCLHQILTNLMSHQSRSGLFPNLVSLCGKASVSCLLVGKVATQCGPLVFASRPHYTTLTQC